MKTDLPRCYCMNWQVVRNLVMYDIRTLEPRPRLNTLETFTCWSIYTTAVVIQTQYSNTANHTGSRTILSNFSLIVTFDFPLLSDKEQDSANADFADSQMDILNIFSRQLNSNEKVIYQTIDWLTQSLSGRFKVRNSRISARILSTSKNAVAYAFGRITLLWLVALCLVGLLWLATMFDRITMIGHCVR